MGDDLRLWNTARLEGTARKRYERITGRGTAVLHGEYLACVEELERRGLTARETVVFDGGPARTGLLLSGADVSILYWALETLDVEAGLNEEEQPIFARLARHVGQPHGIKGEPENLSGRN